MPGSLSLHATPCVSICISGSTAAPVLFQVQQLSPSSALVQGTDAGAALPDQYIIPGSGFIEKFRSIVRS